MRETGTIIDLWKAMGGTYCSTTCHGLLLLWPPERPGRRRPQLTCALEPGERRARSCSEPGKAKELGGRRDLGATARWYSYLGHIGPQKGRDSRITHGLHESSW
jgi:hypothetical protein